jgi:integrase
MAQKYLKKPRRIPKLQLHRASGRGVVRLDGKDIYCGEYGTKSCEKEYNRLMTEWLAGNPRTTNRTGLTITELLADYLDFAGRYYTDSEGCQTRSYGSCVGTAKVLNELYGDTLVEEFTTTRFKTFKQHLIGRGQCRTTVNHALVQARRIFKWGAAEGLLPEQIHRNLTLVPNVKKGRNEAREPEKIKPVADDVIAETLAVLPPILADMVRVQFLTGMRPGEVCRIRPGDLDRNDKIWVYTPHKHKTQWRGKSRFVPVGPKAQEVLLPYLDRSPEAYCFSPRERMEQLRAVRKSKAPPSQENRSKRRSKWQPGLFYKTAAFDRAILSIIRQENVKRIKKGLLPIPEWSPNQLRHSAGTKIRAATDIETARTVLGHSAVSTTEIYAEIDLTKAKAVAEKMG